MSYSTPQQFTIGINLVMTLLSVGLTVARLRKLEHLRFTGSRLRLIFFAGVGSASLALSVIMLLSDRRRLLPIASYFVAGAALMLAHIVGFHFPRHKPAQVEEA